MKKSLAKSAVFNIIYQGLNILFPLISVSYVAKILSPSGVGQVSYAQNIVSYFVMIAALGMPTYGTREISQCREDATQRDKCFSELFLINAISTVISLILYCVVVFFGVREKRLLYIICGLELVFNFINVDWFYRGKEDFVYISVRSMLVKGISLILLFLFVQDEGDCANYALLVCLANGSNFVFNMIRLRREAHFIFHGLELKKHAKPLLSLLICAVAASLYSKIDITMLGSIHTDESVGLYGTAYKIINMATAVIASVTAVFLPRISYYYNNEREKFCDYVTLGLKLVTVVAVPAAIGIALVAKDMMTVLFGEAFTAGATVIVLMSPLIVVKGIGDLLCYQVLVSAGKENRFLASYLMAAVANICLNALLIPVWDYNGAAVASVASELIVNLTLLKYSFLIVKPKLGGRYVTSIALGTIMMIIIVLMTQTYMTQLMGRLLVSIALGGVSYFAVNIALKNEVFQMLLQRLKKQ